MMAVAPAAVYLLCLATSVACALLLLRGYLANRTRLLLWTSLSFACLAVNNLLLVADMVVFPDVDLWLLRQAPTVLALALLLYGFIWDSER